MHKSSLQHLKSAANVRIRLVFVHGFLGSTEDWQPILSYLPETLDAWAVDLPGHGVLKDYLLPSLPDYAQFVASELSGLPDDGTPVVLVGYSLGARILMHCLTEQMLNPATVKAVILEGGNFGLVSRSDREKRWDSDHQWIERFTHEPLESVLRAWYGQPVFSSLNDKQREQVIRLRSQNSASSLAKVLSATSLARQAHLLPELTEAKVPVRYIVGARDSKFCQLYQQAGVRFYTVADAGHNAHKEQPELYAEKLAQLLSL